MKLEDRLGEALQAYLNGEVEQQKFLEAIACEIQTVEQTLAEAPECLEKQALSQALELYVKSLLQLEYWVDTGKQLGPDVLEVIAQHTHRADNCQDVP